MAPIIFNVGYVHSPSLRSPERVDFHVRHRSENIVSLFLPLVYTIRTEVSSALISPAACLVVLLSLVVVVVVAIRLLSLSLFSSSTAFVSLVR